MPPLLTRSSRVVYPVFVLVSRLVQPIFQATGSALVNARSSKWKRDGCNADEGFDASQPRDIAFACLIPVLVLMSGLFAGLTLGYMSLDQTQLNVLSISGTPQQKKYANQIKPIRKNGHLLLVTLLLANMIVNESLPIIADPVLGGGVQSVVVSTVLIVIFAEIIPQSLFTRHGLYLGAKGATFTRFLIILLGVVAWPVAKLLDFILGSNNGIIYRRVELKELIAMHSSKESHGGDLKKDTVAIIGATLDLQEKVVRQAMTPISNVFMLSIDARLDYETLQNIVSTGHSRIPVYEEVDVPESLRYEQLDGKPAPSVVKKIIGILLVKQCVLLDPKDATPVRDLRLNKVPFVPQNEPLLSTIDLFQEGKSHMAIVSRISKEKAKSVKKAVKHGLTQRLRQRVGLGDSSDSSSSSDSDSDDDGASTGSDDTTVREKDYAQSDKKKKSKKRGRKNGAVDIEKGNATPTKRGFAISNLEQSFPADAELTQEGADQFLQGVGDPAIMPLGIITLEDVLEELIGEEIYDEFDREGAHGEPLPVPEKVATSLTHKSVTSNVKSIFRSRSAPPKDRGRPGQPATMAQIPTQGDAGGATAPGTVAVAEAGQTAARIAMPQPIRAAPPAPTLVPTPQFLSAGGGIQPNTNQILAPADATLAQTEGRTRSRPPSLVGTPEPTPFEQMIFERRRKRGSTTGPIGASPAIASGASATNPATVAKRPRMGPKGTFKSERIEPGVSRENGHARAALPRLTVTDTEADGAGEASQANDVKARDERIPDKKDKEGPDKE